MASRVNLPISSIPLCYGSPLLAQIHCRSYQAKNMFENNQQEYNFTLKNYRKKSKKKVILVMLMQHNLQFQKFGEYLKLIWSSGR